MHIIEKDGKDIVEAKDFERRIDMLALILSLKENDKYFDSSEGYQLLLSTYVEMIKNENDQFFIEKEKKENILRSLKRTIDFYSFKDTHSLQICLNEMKADEPTDFMIFPVDFNTSTYGGRAEGHICGLIVYKKNNYFVVTKVDKEEMFDGQSLSYLEIPKESVGNLSELLFYKQSFRVDLSKGRGVYWVLKELINLSKTDSFVYISAELESQKIGNCAVSEPEASLKVALYNCKKDIFSLEGEDEIYPDWNSNYLKDTLEMRKRFLCAMKGENQDWNNHFDYIFSCYAHKNNTYDRRIRWRLYHRDLYIPEMFQNNGKIVKQEEAISKEKRNDQLLLIKKEYSEYEATDEELKSMDESKLMIDLYDLKGMLKRVKKRLSLINIERAKNLLQQEKKYLQKRRKVYRVEIKRRQEIKLESKEENQKSLISTKNVGLNQKEEGELQPFKKVEELAKKNYQERKKEEGESLLTVQYTSEKGESKDVKQGTIKDHAQKLSKTEDR